MQSQTVALPKPKLNEGISLAKALSDRRSARSFRPDQLPIQTLSNLLWAASGVNRPESGFRTAPSAMNRQGITIYVSTARNLFQYCASTHSLQLIVAEDIRAVTGTQAFVKDAPLNLVYVAEHAAAGETPAEETDLYHGADAGAISENVYLFCASEGLATVVRGDIDRPALAGAMGLNAGQKIVLAQTVGFQGEAAAG